MLYALIAWVVISFVAAGAWAAFFHATKPVEVISDEPDYTGKLDA